MRTSLVTVERPLAVTLLFVLTLEPETDEERVTLSRSWTLMLLVAAELEDLVAEVLDDLVAEELEDLVADWLPFLLSCAPADLVTDTLEDLVAEVLDDLVAEVLDDLVAVVLVVERVVLLLLLPLFRRV